MAIRDTITIRVKKIFVEDCLDKIIEIERKKGRDDTSYATASKILRDRIISAGGIKQVSLCYIMFNRYIKENNYNFLCIRYLLKRR